MPLCFGSEDDTVDCSKRKSAWSFEVVCKFANYAMLFLSIGSRHDIVLNDSMTTYINLASRTSISSIESRYWTMTASIVSSVRWTWSLRSGAGSSLGSGSLCIGT